MTPKITIITVTYNCQDSIEETMSSVINQTYKNIEYLIIDGGSLDGTISIINKFKNKISFFISEKDEGIYDAMNKGIKIATGEWILFLNSGDIFFSNSVVSDIKWQSISNHFAVVYGNTLVKNNYGEKVIDSIKSKCKEMPFCHQSVFVRSSILKKKPFNTRYKIAADYDFFYNLHKEKYKYFYIPYVISIYDGVNGISSLQPLMLFKEKGRIREEDGTFLWKLNLFLFILKLAVKSKLPIIISIYKNYKYKHNQVPRTNINI